jgi:hypothetical protein
MKVQKKQGNIQMNKEKIISEIGKISLDIIIDDLVRSRKYGRSRAS